MGNFQSALEATPQDAGAVQHVKFGWTGRKEEMLSFAPRDSSRTSVHPLMEPSVYEESSTDGESNSSSGRQSSCCKMCSLFIAVFLVFAVLGAFVFFLICRSGYAEPVSQVISLPTAQLDEDRSIGWWSMPRKQPFSDLRRAQSRLYKQQTRSLAGMNMSFGVALGSNAPRMMFYATKVEGVWDQVPEKLRGVFWVRGHGREELMVLQYSRWFESGGLLVVPTAPFSYAWSAGSRAEAADGEGFFYEPQAAEHLSLDAILEGPTHSFKFSVCPPGAACSRGHNLAYAEVQVHPTGSTLTGRSPSSLHGRFLALQDFWKGSESLQEEFSEVPGTRWRVVEDWGLLRCNCVQHQVRTYEKIVDGDGEPMEPQYSDFLRVVGGDPLYFWTGWPSEEERRAAGKKFFARAMNVH